MVPHLSLSSGLLVEPQILSRGKKNKASSVGMLQPCSDRLKPYLIEAKVHFLHPNEFFTEG